MPTKPARLGRGLSTLISPRELVVPGGEPSAADAQRLQQISVDRIRPNPRQPRRELDAADVEELAASIRSSGVLQPVLLRPLGDDNYELVAGERRWRAARQAGLARIPAILRSVSDAESLELALIENLQREDLDPLERAAAYRQFLDTFKLTADELAERLGESRANIANYVRLLSLRKEIQEMIHQGQLAMGQARAIAGIEEPRRQLAIAQMTVRRNLSVRHVEALAKSDSAPRRTAPEATPADRHLADVERSLSGSLGLPVRLRPGKKKNSGRIIIEYRNLDEFDRVAERIGGRATLE